MLGYIVPIETKRTTLTSEHTSSQTLEELSSDDDYESDNDDA